MHDSSTPGNPPNFDPQSWSNISEYPIPYGNKRFGGQSGEAQSDADFDKCDETLVDTVRATSNIFFADFWPVSRLTSFPHAPCAMPNGVPMRIGC